MSALLASSPTLVCSAVVRGRRSSAIVALVMLALAALAHRYRRDFIQQFFVVGPGGAPPPELPAGRGDSLAPAPRTRVVLVDGLGADLAHRLPGYQAACAAGLDLTVDVGFPTVSLPVQHALWTGLTQQQSGVQFAVAKVPPSPHDIPGQVPGSVAVTEGHPEIVGSFRFAKAIEVESPGELEAAALAAVTGPAPLAFVHILRVDRAGHHHGAASPEYLAAATSADGILARLRAADPESRWFVLADHGHRAAGGHGGAEPAIRRVRACISGPGVPRAAPGATIHLIDLSRAVADSVGATPAPGAAGRPLGAALDAGVPDAAALPRPAPWRWVAAAALLLLAGLATGRAVPRRWRALPLWWPLAYLGVVALAAAPSLSVPMVYKPLGRTIYVAGLPGLCLLALLAALAARRLPVARVALAALAIPAAAAASSLILAGAGAPGPPLMPAWTARASVSLVLLFSGAVVLALVALATCVRPGSGRTTPPGSGGAAP